MQKAMKQWVMASRPKGLVKVEDFRLEEVAIPNIRKGEALVKTLYLGVAPVMLRYMTNETTFEKPMEIGDVMIGRGVGCVVASKSVAFKEGDLLQTKLGWREYGVIKDEPYYMTYKMATQDLSPSYGVGALGMNGFTSLIGMQEICKVKKGDKVLVSGAAGSVGSMAGFVAKALGCDILVGIAGGPEKCTMLTESLGYDYAIDYKTDGVPKKLDELFPDGIDVFFDNVGGELLDEVLGRINRRARIAICGRISEYLIPPEAYHRPRNMYRIGLKDAKMEGFFVYDYQAEYPNYEKQLAQWIREGRLRPLEDIGIGLEEMPNALISLYKGTNGGTRMVKVFKDQGSVGKTSSINMP
ncbi:NADP-dependent oxidoreductase [Maribacter sp. 2210JD10-5]|uniref:NADP-dependent oxidoreductase n=1 Tax=Maribacter sp. 2210JD10-5 TaxID=3386272 RepID=UPI0039BD6999